MATEVKFEGLEELQGVLLETATMNAIKKVVAHQERNLLNELTKHAVRASEGGVFAGGYSGEEQSIGGIKNSASCELFNGGLSIEIGTTAEYAPYVEYGTTKMPAEPFMQPTAIAGGEKFVKELRKVLK